MILRRTLLATPALLPAAALAQAVPPSALPPSALPPSALPIVAQDDSTAPGWRRATMIRWGDRVTFDAPPFDPARLDAEGAGTQFGWDARIAALVVPPPAADGVRRAVLAVAHPTVNPAMAFPGGVDRPEVASRMQGASLLNLEQQGGRWIIVDGGFQARRLTAANLCSTSGPGAETLGGAVRGVLAPTGGAATPWGTLLLTEGDPTPWAGRLPDFGRGEAYGWVVELDALDPQSIPVKQTALGRFPKADAAAAASRDGRAVVFLAEQGAGGYLFRFVSEGPAAPGALALGTLAAARMQGGRLTWLALPPAAYANPSEAARQAGATAMDRPQGLDWDARGNRLLACGDFGALTLTPDGGDPAAESMSVGRLGGQGMGSQGMGRLGSVSADPRGRVLLGGLGDGVVGATAQPLWLAEGGRTNAIYGAPRAADVGGAVASPDGGTIFAAVRRPGAEQGSSFARPATRWPEFAAGQPPRSAIIALTRG